MLSLMGIPTPEIMEKVDKVKKLLIDDIYHPWRFLYFKKWKDNFESQALLKINSLPLNLDVTPSAYEIGKFMTSLTSDEILGYIATVIIGYDMAYRLRIQDILNEADYYGLQLYPRKELKRLWGIYKKRESIIGDYMIPKARRVYLLLQAALLIPKFKRALREAVIKTDWSRIAFTEEDKEWIKQRIDYKFKI